MQVGGGSRGGIVGLIRRSAPLDPRKEFTGIEHFTIATAICFHEDQLIALPYHYKKNKTRFNYFEMDLVKRSLYCSGHRV